ncbi:fumarylacetoacetase [Longispora albida]|uniref:fumarylacetoacetase n=1 Tax=Longispora albida TaxID=203523 RepID=UPI0003AAE1F7|nr:fumarylacetoacetase [Longispora albida]
MSWVPGADGPWGVHNLPYGVADGRIVVRIGDYALDLQSVLALEALRAPVLNDFMALGPSAWAAVRERIVELLSSEEHRAEVEQHLSPLAGKTMSLPFTVGDYVDFYSSEDHATNVGKLFRPGQPPLLPNWKHIPIGYHGRSGTVVVSGTEVRRPSGQRSADGGPVFGPSVRLDIEAEVGFVVGVPSVMGETVGVDSFAEHVFGVVLVNDWSARDIQAWEYVPLGPFLGKSFATSVSAWVTPLAAFARVAAPAQDPVVLPYLAERERYTFGLDLEVDWNGSVVARPPFAGMYWTPAQQLAHMTVNGASVRTGDLFASGTVSGPERGQVGSFLELTWSGAEPVKLADGSTRTFIEDGDTVTLTATAPGANGQALALGEVTGRVVA